MRSVIFGAVQRGTEQSSIEASFDAKVTDLKGDARAAALQVLNRAAAVKRRP